MYVITIFILFFKYIDIAMKCAIDACIAIKISKLINNKQV